MLITPLLNRQPKDMGCLDSNNSVRGAKTCRKGGKLMVGNARDNYEQGRTERGWWYDGKKTTHDPDYKDPLEISYEDTKKDGNDKEENNNAEKEKLND